MRSMCVCFLLCILCGFLHAGGGTRKADFAATIGFNNQNALETELSASYLFGKYVGATVGFNIYGEAGDYMRQILWNWFEDAVLGIDREDEYYDCESGWYVNKLLLRLAIRFRMPVVTIFEDWYLSLNTEPGLYINLTPNDRVRADRYRKHTDWNHTSYRDRYVRNKGGNVVFWNIKSFFELQADRVVVSAGYLLSNMDLYSGRRNIIIDGAPLGNLLGARKMSHTAFVSIGFVF